MLWYVFGPCSVASGPGRHPISGGRGGKQRRGGTPNRLRSALTSPGLVTGWTTNKVVASPCWRAINQRWSARKGLKKLVFFEPGAAGLPAGQDGGAIERFKVLEGLNA